MSQGYPEPTEMEIMEFPVTVDDALGHLIVAHDGPLTWDQLKAIKCLVWGNETRAIEVYPASADVVNSDNFRHLWRLGADDFWARWSRARPLSAAFTRHGMRPMAKRKSPGICGNDAGRFRHRSFRRYRPQSSGLARAESFTIGTGDVCRYVPPALTVLQP